MIVFHNILQRLSEAGYSTYFLQRNKIIPSSCLDRLRNGKPVTTDTLDTVCRLCNCQPGDLITYQPDEADPEE